MSHKVKDEILTMLIEHVRIVHGVLSDMGVYYTTWAEKNESNKDNLEKKKNKMIISEQDGDNIKIELIQEFAEAEAQGMGNFIELVLKMDNVINYAIEFVDILEKIKNVAQVDEEVKKRYHKLINNIIKMGNTLKFCVKNLRDNPKEVFNNTTQIHEIENDIDLISREFLDHIYGDENINVRLLLRIKDSINILEGLADRIHDIGDAIRVLIYQ